MPQYDYDYFVIGAGSGGVRSSRIAASHGAKVGVAEDLHMGGTCVNVGCVPKKLFSYAAHFAHDFEDAVGFGWEDIKHNFDWPTLVKNKNTEIERLNGIYRTMLGNAGVTIHDGRASFIDEHSLQVGDKTITADKILIAVGGWPSKPDYKGAEHGITSNEAFYLEKLPEKMVIVGGGFIAVEFACIFNALGVEIHLLYRSELFMRGFDLDIRKTLAEEMEKQGIHLHFNTDITEVSKDGDTLTLSLTTDKTMECDCLFYAIGRHPKVEGLGLEKIGIETDKGNAIIVNDDYQTNIPHIYALGDVTNRINLTPVALAEGHVLADNLFNKTSRKVSYDNVASAVFSNPPISTVGLSEEDATAQYGDITVFESRFRPMKYTLSGRDEKSYMKLIVDTKTDKILGCHMLGQDAPEIMQAIAIAMNMGATKADFDRTIGIHPTAAEEFVTLRTARE